jgi:hypothetical protein
MFKKQYVAVIAGPIAILTVLLSIFNIGPVDTHDDQIDRIVIRVTYSGAWEGVIYSNEKVQMVSGFVNKNFVVVKSNSGEWTVSFEAKKIGDSTNKMIVEFELLNGTRLDNAQTTDAYGKVSLSTTFG